MSPQRDRRLKRILVASAWTGGHIFPGVSIVEELKRNLKKIDVFFVTDREGPVTQLLKRYGYSVLFLKTNNLAEFFISFFNSFKLINKICPDVIIGLGGRLTAAICIAGKIKGIPIYAHEQNVIPGFTNRILYRLAVIDTLFVSFKETKDILGNRRCVYSGNPVREEFFFEKKEKEALFTIFVMGGSQGATVINKVFLDTLGILLKRGYRFKIIHQTGRYDFENVKKRYKEIGVDAQVYEFIDDMPSVLKRVDLAICRAGASSLFELSASGTPSILIPYPFAKDNHQEKNALILKRIGGAEVILQKDLTPSLLADMISRFLDNPQLLKDMGNNAKKLARRDSAKIITKYILEAKGL